MKRTFLFALSLALLAACMKDDRENFMVPDSFGITSRSSLVQASVHKGSCTVGIAKNGKGRSAAQVQIAASGAGAASALEAYNAANRTSFTALPESAFSLSASSLSYEVSDVVKTVDVSWDPEQMASLVDDGKDLVIPVCISSGDLDVNSASSFVLIQPLRTSVALSQTAINRSASKRNTEADASGRQPVLRETVTLDLESSNAIKGAVMEFPVLIDNSLIPAWNKENEAAAQPAPEGLVSLADPSVTIPEGGKSASFRVTIDKSVLLDGDGKLQEFPDYLAPVRIDVQSMKATLDGEPFELKGLGYGNLTAYICIRYQKSSGGVSITREWGRFSSEEDSWSAYIPDFTAGSERNVAIDDEWIYLAETNTKKHVWAISIADPGVYKALPVGTVKDDGIFSVSCPRIIPNTDSSVNGGRDVLAVCNMKEGDPTLYIYDKGTAEDPSVLNLTTWASRRLGDTFTTWGSLQDGLLMFKDFNTDEGTVTFRMSGKTDGTLYLVGRVVAPPATGAGAYFPFPDNINAGVCSTRGGDKAWLCRTSQDLLNLAGADKSPELTLLSGYYADTAFRFFEYDGKRFVAYTRQVNSRDGRLIVLQGSAEESWEAILDRRTVIYQAAIQENAENQEEYGVSPLSSGNSGMDLDAREIGGNVYIAVVKQNVGLSLFKMTLD